MALLKRLIVLALAACASSLNVLNAAPCPYWTWDGFYVGVNAGIVRGYDKISLTAKGLWGTTPQAVQNFLHVNGSTSLSNWNFIGGGQVGYNYQHKCWLLGLEADGNYVNLSAHRNTPQIVEPVLVQRFGFKDRIEHNWLATVRPRIGYTICQFLPYITGGFAAGDARVRSNIYGVTTNYSSEARRSKILYGWTVGAGLEYPIRPFLSLKAEYLYVNLGHFNTTSVPGPGFEGFFEERRICVREDILRLGLNYRL
ncbi:outer membrane protein [Chlamydiota bacterium]